MTIGSRPGGVSGKVGGVPGVETTVFTSAPPTRALARSAGGCRRSAPTLPARSGALLRAAVPAGGVDQADVRR